MYSILKLGRSVSSALRSSLFEFDLRFFSCNLFPFVSLFVCLYFFFELRLNYNSVDVVEGERTQASNSRFIHPGAIVHPNAIIGEGVSIGPFCSVSSSASLGNGCRLYPGSHIFGSTKLGDNCILMTGAVVGDDLPGCTTIGSNNTIGYHAVIGVKCQDLKYKPEDECFLEVGDNNNIREHTSIHRSSKSTDKTVIGDNNLIMGSCHIAHDCKVGNNNIFANNTLLAGHVKVEDYVHTAGATVVHQFCHLGSFSFLGGGSVVSQDVPKYMMVAGERAELRGLNVVGLRRQGFSITEEQHEELISIPAVRAMLQSICNSFAEDRRGICKFRHWNST